MNKTVIFSIVILALVVVSDFFSRIYIGSTDVKERAIESFSYETNSANYPDVELLLANSFPSLLAQEEEELAKQQKLKAQHEASKAGNQKGPNSQQQKQKLLSQIKVVGVINRNGISFAVIETLQNGKKRKVETVSQGEPFSLGKVLQVKSSEVELEVQGSTHLLPVFKDKNIKVEG